MVLNTKGLKLVHLNVRSLIKHKDEVFRQLSGMHVIGLSETWLKKSCVCKGLIKTDGYSHIRQDRSIISKIVNGREVFKSGGGLIFYIKNEMSPYINLIGEFSSCTADIEQLWVEFNKAGNKRLVIGLIYRPPSGNVRKGINELQIRLKKLVRDRRYNNADIVIMGDFNIDYLKPRNYDVKLLKDLGKSFNLKQTVIKPTRITSTSKSIIDLIFTNIIDISDTGVLNCIISDHLPTYIIRKKMRQKYTKVRVIKRRYKGYDAGIFGLHVERDWRWQYFWGKSVSPNQLWDIMLCILTSVANKLYPRKCSVIHDKQPRWITDSLSRKIRFKNCIYRKACISNSKEDWDLYKCTKKKVTRLLRSAKKRYIVGSLNSNCGDPKKFWQDLGENFNIGRRSGTTGVEAIKNNDGLVLTGKQAADNMNEYYVNVGKKLNVKFDTTWKPSTYLENLNVTKFSFQFVTENVVKNVLKFLLVNKSSCVRELSSRLVRDGMLFMLTETTFLIMNV